MLNRSGINVGKRLSSPQSVCSKPLSGFTLKMILKMNYSRVCDLRILTWTEKICAEYTSENKTTELVLKSKQILLDVPKMTKCGTQK